MHECIEYAKYLVRISHPAAEYSQVKILVTPTPLPLFASALLTTNTVCLEAASKERNAKPVHRNPTINNCI